MAAESTTPRQAPHPAGDARATAIMIIKRWLQAGAFPGRLLEDVRHDRAFITELVYGVVRHYRALSWVINLYARVPPDRELLPPLLIGLYQLLLLDDVADYAAVNETVAYVKQRRPRAETGFVNALLRQVTRTRPECLRRLTQQPPGIRLSHPDRLLQRWTAHYGADRALKLCEWNNRRAAPTVCANNLLAAPERVRADLAAQDALAGSVKAWNREFLVVSRGVAVPALPGFTEGLWLPVDPAAGAAVQLLAVQSGQRVLDACAAPGGKTALLAADLEGQGELTAWEPQAARLQRLQENLLRLRLESFVRTRQVNALHPPADAGRFDRILLDVPCSNTGVIRHKPDVRWRFSLNRMRQLNRLQTALLTAAAGLLRPGGRMVYSTCSLEPEENRMLVDDWLKEKSGFRRVDEAVSFPPQSGMDGLYAAAIACR
ncbi:MAG: RsmB/NOP family class I SAM-dependent RNA methyltransferase [Kiritimatiellia bacterium]